MIEESYERKANNNDVSALLKKIAKKIATGISDISFAINIEDQKIKLTQNDFDLSIIKEQHETISFTGRWRDITIVWNFTELKSGYAVSLSAESNFSLNLNSIESLIIKYKPEKNYFNWRLLRNSTDYVNNPIGFPILKDVMDGEINCNMLTGIFPDNKKNGLFFGTMIPQSSLHHYRLFSPDNEGIIFNCATSFVSSLKNSNKLISEVIWITGNLCVKDAFSTYSSFLPKLADNTKPAVGWNSWDYYSFTISLDGIIENMEEISKDAKLLDKIKYIVVDDGWEHMVGEWKPNYKFQYGFENLIKEISDRGFIPGIWTSPILINPTSYAAMRMPEIMIKNQYGDPLLYDNYFLIDPTAPAGKEYIKEIYRSLYNVGFRFFKVDFVSFLLHADRFHDTSKGPYDVLKELFESIRECVTTESHILGCSLPAECGPGLADSGRTGIDIHNQWSHLEWAVECFTFKYWANNRIWINDLDFLIVRGLDTSLEKKTNVLNTDENNPNSSRWRKGHVFTKKEAQTWTNIIMFSGGNVFLSDRISMINEDGKKMLNKGLEDAGVIAEPLDLCCGYHASLWLQKIEDDFRLTIINWSDEEKEGAFDFQEFNLKPIDYVVDFWTNEIYKINKGVFQYKLDRHESIVIKW